MTPTIKYNKFHAILNMQVLDPEADEYLERWGWMAEVGGAEAEARLMACIAAEEIRQEKIDKEHAELVAKRKESIAENRRLRANSDKTPREPAATRYELEDENRELREIAEKEQREKWVEYHRQLCLRLSGQQDMESSIGPIPL